MCKGAPENLRWGPVDRPPFPTDFKLNFNVLITKGKDEEYCNSKVNVLRGLMLVTSMVCLMVISFLFMQV